MDLIDTKLKEFWVKDFLTKYNEIEFLDEIPSFTSIYKQEKLVASSINQVEKYRNSDLHSEMICIKKAQTNLNTRYLTDCSLITSLEPCFMCSGAIIQSRVQNIIYFAENRPGEGISSFPVESIYTKNHFPFIEKIENREISLKWKEFFQRKRS